MNIITSLVQGASIYLYIACTNLRMFIFKGLHNPKIMRTFEPKMLADRHRTTADSFLRTKA